GACGGGGGGMPSPTAAPEPFAFDVPAGFPQPKTDLPMSDALVDLGRHLFYDERLSLSGNGGCVACHEQRLAFTDGRATSLAPGGAIHPRNAMSLTNAVYNARQNWANPNVRTLREQALAVLLNQDPVELGWAGREQQILDRFRADGDYVARFAAAFPDDVEPYSLANVATALAAFTATLISGRTAYDRNDLDEAARRGEALFFSERLECNHCHNGFNLANSVVHSNSTLDNIEYKNNALYNIPGPATGYPLAAGNYPTDNQGLYPFTFRSSDMGRFRPPTLRNIALTAPYMHDGSIATLRELIVDHYARGGRLIAEGPLAGDGRQSPLKDPLMIGFTISATEVDDLLAFFDSLTDWDFICDDRLSDPFGQIPMHSRCTDTD
ncbi:MAG TPA: MbnH family di-heme enzyme, partial [Fontimonas sp.]